MHKTSKQILESSIGKEINERNLLDAGNSLVISG